MRKGREVLLAVDPEPRRHAPHVARKSVPGLRDEVVRLTVLGGILEGHERDLLRALLGSFAIQTVSCLAQIRVLTNVIRAKLSNNRLHEGLRITLP